MPVPSRSLSPDRARPARSAAHSTEGSARPASAGLERLCRERGLRLTPRRRLLAKLIAEAADHPDAEELHRRAAREDPRISLSTVYRTVKLFEGLNLAERHAFEGGRARFEAAKPGDRDAHHDHLIDVKTGRVVEFRSEEIERAQAEIARRLGYRLVGHRLELYAIPLTGEGGADGENGGEATESQSTGGHSTGDRSNGTRGHEARGHEARGHETRKGGAQGGEPEKNGRERLGSGRHRGGDTRGTDEA